MYEIYKILGVQWFKTVKSCAGDEMISVYLVDKSGKTSVKKFPVDDAPKINTGDVIEVRMFLSDECKIHRNFTQERIIKKFKLLNSIIKTK